MKPPLYLIRAGVGRSPFSSVRWARLPPPLSGVYRSRGHCRKTLLDFLHCVEKVFPFDAKLEDDTVDVYNQFLLVCRENGDSISMKLFETIIDEEQAHFNYFDNVAGHIRTLGPAFLAQKAGTSAETGASASGFVAQQGGA